jgi:hypothetical protein
VCAHEKRKGTGKQVQVSTDQRSISVEQIKVPTKCFAMDLTVNEATHL